MKDRKDNLAASGDGKKHAAPEQPVSGATGDYKIRAASSVDVVVGYSETEAILLRWVPKS